MSVTARTLAEGLSPEDADRLVRKIERREKLYPYLLISPTLFVLVVVALLPLLYAIFLSLHEMKFAQIEGFAGFENYVTLFTDSRFWHSLVITFLFVVIAVPIEFMLSLIGALILSQNIRFRSIIIPALFIPTMMAPIVVGIVWKIMLAGSWGFLSYNFLERFGFVDTKSIFSSSDWALFALIFVDIWQWTPFMMLAFFAGLQALPASPYRAAAVDGASPIQQFFSLTFPLMIPLMAVIGLIRMIDSFKVFDKVFLLTAGGPGASTEVISIYGYKMVFSFWQIGPASALAVIVWALFFVFCNIFYQVAARKLKAF